MESSFPTEKQNDTTKEESKPQQLTQNEQLLVEDVEPLMEAISSRYEHQSQEKEDVRLVVKALEAEANEEDHRFGCTRSQHHDQKQQQKHVT